jgi:hypothetical protein
MVLNPQDLTTVQEPPAATLTGQELVRIVQGGFSAKTTIGAFAGVGGGYTFSTRAAAVAASIDPTLSFVSTEGYTTVGDGGGATYVRTGGSTTGGFRSADGQWWKYVVQGPTIDVRQFGADPFAGVDSTTAFNNALAIAAQNTYAIGDPNFTSNGPEVLANGKFGLTGGLIANPSQPVVLKVYGALQLFTSSLLLQGNLEIIGLGGGLTGPIQVGDVAFIDGSNLPSGVPAITLFGPGTYLANLNVSSNNVDPGMFFNGLPTISSTTRLDNVCVESFGGSSPPVLIQNYFWIWCNHCRFSTTTATNSVHITNVSSALTGLTWAGGTATATTSASIGLPVGTTFAVTIDGCTPSGYNNTSGVTATVTGGNTFTYPIVVNPGLISILGNITSTSSSGLIYFDDYVLSGGGITVDAPHGATAGNCFFRNGTIENGNSGAYAFTLDGSVTPLIDVTIDGFAIADSPFISGFLKTLGEVRNLHLLGQNDLKYAVNVSTGSVQGLQVDGGPSGGASVGSLATGWLAPQSITGHIGDFLLGSLLNIGDLQSPAVMPVLPQLISQDASLWDAIAVGAGSSVTIAYGVTAPDGTPTAATITSAGGTAHLTFQNMTITPTVNDTVILGGYVKNPNPGTQVFDAYSLSADWNPANGITFDSTRGENNILTAGAGNIFGPWHENNTIGAWTTGAWIPVSAIAKITAASSVPGSSNLRFKAQVTSPAAPISVWRPWIYYIPAAAGLSADEIFRFFQTLRRGVVNLDGSNSPVVIAQAGDVALHDHQKLLLGGGARLDSRPALPNKYVYLAGDRTVDKSGGTDGWLCVTAGGAFSTTRNASVATAYATGVWALWSTGTTVSECTQSGTNSGGALAAPTSVGQVVTDGTVKWTCRSLTAAAFVNAAYHSASLPVVVTTNYTVQYSDYQIIANNTGGGLTLTLPASPVPGRELRVKSYTTNAVSSASSNVVPIAGGTAGSSIIMSATTAGHWSVIAYNGTNWEIMLAI